MIALLGTIGEGIVTISNWVMGIAIFLFVLDVFGDNSKKDKRFSSGWKNNKVPDFTLATISVLIFLGGLMLAGLGHGLLSLLPST